jgi:hypothetical protein
MLKQLFSHYKERYFAFNSRKPSREEERMEQKSFSQALTAHFPSKFCPKS